MPELPEVTTVLTSLLPHLKSKTIQVVLVLHQDVVGWPESTLTFAKNLCGQKIIDGSRRGKYLLFKLSNSQILIIHLRMTGRLILVEPKHSRAKHTHLVLSFADKELHFIDPRRFGRIFLIKSGEETKAGGLAKLGIEPLSSEFTLEVFANKIKAKRSYLKSLLLNQEFIAGLGNIYVDEILFKAQLHPLTKSENLSDQQIANLFNSIQKTLQQAIANRGTTFRDYRDGQDQSGNFQDLLTVYNRKGEQCGHCSCVIEKQVICGRGTYFCPQCQKGDKNGLNSSK